MRSLRVLLKRRRQSFAARWGSGAKSRHAKNSGIAAFVKAVMRVTPPLVAKIANRVKTARRNDVARV